MNRPFWFPDSKGWAAVGYFALAFTILAMIWNDKTFLANAAFMGVVGGVMGAGGIGLIIAFYYGSSSGAKDANARTDRVLDAIGKDPAA